MLHNHDFAVPRRRARRAPVAAIIERAGKLSRRELNAAIEGLIAFVDALDGDPDLEEETDHCAAGDDQVIGGPIIPPPWFVPGYIGSDDDAETCGHPLMDEDLNYGKHGNPFRRRAFGSARCAS